MVGSEPLLTGFGIHLRFECCKIHWLRVILVHLNQRVNIIGLMTIPAALYSCQVSGCHCNRHGGNFASSDSLHLQQSSSSNGGADTNFNHSNPSSITHHDGARNGATLAYGFRRSLFGKWATIIHTLWKLDIFHLYPDLVQCEPFLESWECPFLDLGITKFQDNNVQKFVKKSRNLTLKSNVITTLFLSSVRETRLEFWTVFESIS